MSQTIGDFVEMSKIVPEAEEGNVKIKHFTISKHDVEVSRMRFAVTGNRHEEVSEGQYVKLLVNNHLVMSDTKMEQRSNIYFLNRIRLAGGNMLVAGLGLGMILLPALRYSNVTSIDVVELEPFVIKLIEPYLRKTLDPKAYKKLNVIEAGILDWTPPKGKKWDVIYFDIWGDICVDNLKEVTYLKRKFARRLNRNNPKAWMGAWMEDDLRYLRGR